MRLDERTEKRALVVLWTVAAVVIAWVWLRPLHYRALPPPAEHRKTTTPRATPLDDDAPADEPQAAPLASGGVPEQPTRRDLEGAIDHARERVEACHKVENVAGVVTVKLVIAASGSLTSVSVLPPFDKTRTADCVRHALTGLTFPRFRGTYFPTIEWTYPFVFKGAEGG